MTNWVTRDCASIEVRFSPNGGVAESIINGLGIAEESIYINAFSFTHKGIAQAIIKAFKRNVKVEVILDGENLKNPHSCMRDLLKHQIPVYIDKRHAIAHNKVLIIDETIVYTGSANLTKGGSEKNAENSIKIMDYKIANLYFKNWRMHKKHSQLHT